MQNVTLNNGVEMPILGFGVFQIPAGRDRAGRRPTPSPPATGSLDTAAVLRQRGGRRPRRIEASGIPREELFVTTKLWIQTTPARTTTRRAFERLAAAARPRLPRPVPDPPAASATTTAPGGRWRSSTARAGPGPSASPTSTPTGSSTSSTTTRSPRRSTRSRPTRSTSAPPTRSSCASTASRSSPGARSPRAGTTCSPTRSSPPSARRTASPSPRSCCAGSSSAASSSSPSRSAPSGWRENLDVFDFELTDDEMARIATLDTGGIAVLRPPRPRHGQLAGRTPDRLSHARLPSGWPDRSPGRIPLPSAPGHRRPGAANTTGDP